MLDIETLDRDGLVRSSLALLATTLGEAGGAKPDEYVQIRLSPMTIGVAALLVEELLEATAAVRTREVTSEAFRQAIQALGQRVVAQGGCICVGSREDGGGCCVCF
jgi:hypothetical protein